MSSWKPEVITDDTGGRWFGNNLRFATEAETEEYLKDLPRRWSAVRDTRAVEVNEPVTHIWSVLLGRAVDLADPSRVY